MANIELAPLLRQKMREFSTSSDDFHLDFIDAVNRAINKINIEADLETRISRVKGPDETVSLDATYEHVLSDGISFMLLKGGFRPARKMQVIFRDLKEDFEEGIDSIRQNIVNVAQEDDADDNTTDITLLGTIGE